MSTPDVRPFRILCFGDSNTWGYDPVRGGRYSESVRWTKILQRQLGNRFEVIEEGLNGRTTIFDYKQRFGKSGANYLRTCLDSHFPVHAAVLYLGTNDTKVEFNLSPPQISEGMEALIKIVRGQGLESPSPNVKILLVAPTQVREAYLGDYKELVGSEAKTKALPALYEKLAERYNTDFLDLSKVEPSPADGCHLSPEAHAQIAAMFAGKMVNFAQASV